MQSFTLLPSVFSEICLLFLCVGSSTCLYDNQLLRGVLFLQYKRNYPLPKASRVGYHAVEKRCKKHNFIVITDSLKLKEYLT